MRASKKKIIVLFIYRCNFNAIANNYKQVISQKKGALFFKKK